MRLDGALVRELEKPAIAGMSGGPLCIAGTGQTLGIQSRNEQNDGIATAIDFAVLDPCFRLARNLFP